VNFTGNITGGVTYSWTNNNPAIGLAAFGTGDIASFTATNPTNAPITATITVTPTANGCTGTSTSFDFTIDPTPTVNKPNDQTKCNGSPTDAVNFTGNITGGVTYNWTNDNTDIGLAASGTGNIASFTATNSTNAPITGTITVTPTINSCTGTSISFDFTIDPSPTVTKPANQTKCNGAPTDPVNFAGNITNGVTYNWTNSNPAIGLAASGTGDIAPFTATNSTNARITATITVTPTANNCQGTSTSFDFTIDPSPTVTKPADQTKCNGTATDAINFTGNITGGVTYTWTNSNPDIGLAAGGTGNIAPFTATNTASMQISGIITVTPTFNGCQGTPVSFTIKVTPTPTVIDPPTDGVRCGAGGVTLGAKASAGEIKWYTTQTGGTAVWTGTNYTTPDISATTSYWVEAVDNNCTSLLPRTQVKAIINQKPTVDFDYSEQTICEGNETQVYIINPTPGATFTWVNDATIIEKNSDGSVITVKPPYKKSGNNYQSTYPYTVIVNDGCEQSFTAMVKIDEALHGSIVATLPQICEGISTTINAGSYNAYTYSWTSTALDIVKPESRVTVSPAETTTYMLDMSRGVCTAADAITIDVNSKPVILSIDSVGVRNREIIYEQGTGTPPFKFGVDGVPANDNPVKYDLSFGMHSFYIIDAAGCRSNAADRLVDVPKFFIPPSFSPNGDGVNDRWEIPSMNEIFPDAVITIYDRYGKELTKYSGTDQGWNGTYLGREMPTTDYWYIIDIEEINKQYVGHFTLLRK
jgi:gliding motility-associated-like protein